ncbi:Origin recognition complex subunit 6 [Madurella mycetomatis]|uniref:Origin recognition complex subunit 6 n=1 Tax=Madurella mycetomatis TaxID=100816 RepID=A0A175W183_9PEZI|nr:Origin recognition complex subunit 6 [Madurella mycetomatis]
MNRSIEQALLSLLPTHNSTLPQPLTELASSLLAQSRHRASTLKAEEEIARPYACAHLACDRLKVTLDLPPIDPRPPIPPRIYKRLYSHLDKILPSSISTPGRGTPSGTLGSGRIRTPSSKLRDQQLLGTSPLANKTRPTPTKDKSFSQFTTTTTTTTTTPSKKHTPNPKQQQTTSDPLPRWIRPTLHFLTTHLGPSRIGPVVAAGLESIITPRGKLTDDGWVLANLVAVLGAVYLFVWRGVTWPGREIDQGRYVKFRKELAAALRKARGGVTGLREEDWEGWAEVGGREFDTAALRVHRHGWFDMEWATGVEDLVGREEASGEWEEEDGKTVVVQVRGGDSMFQERYDYLSERKRKAYAEWKGGLMKKIKELEKGVETR